MWTYICRRLVLVPITLFFIVLVNFVIINLAPGEPTAVMEISQTGEATQVQGRAFAFGADERYLYFREHYGLTLPILFNIWPFLSKEDVQREIQELVTKKESPSSSDEISFQQEQDLRVKLGDEARFVMPKLLSIMNDPNESFDVRVRASQFFSRGGTLFQILGPSLNEDEERLNKEIAKNNLALKEMTPSLKDSKEEIQKKFQELNDWYEKNKNSRHYEPGFWEKIKIFFLESRFIKYFTKVLTLDFGTIRDDPNKTVIHEVARRFKYSLTLAIIPMIITFFACMAIGLVMAAFHRHFPDYFLNIFFLILYAIPIFVAAPFLIEKVALNKTFPFTHTPIPFSGFTSPDDVYNQLTSSGKLLNTLQHIFLPLIAIMYGSIAAQARLTRGAMLEVSKQDYVKTAFAKGLTPWKVWVKHIGRNGSITLITSIAGSLGIVLGGSLIVETLFEINGFGKFFYDAVVNRDYNVIMFSALVGSFLTLIGYIVADVAYTVLDPRVTLD